MKADSFVLRPAQASDADEIWHLLHSEGKGRSVEQIRSELGQLYVLTHQKRVLGVLCGTITPGRETLSWVVTHPMYPHGPLRDVMEQGFWGVLCPFTKGPAREDKKRPSFEWRLGLKGFLPLFKSRV